MYKSSPSPLWKNITISFLTSKCMKSKVWLNWNAFKLVLLVIWGDIFIFVLFYYLYTLSITLFVYENRYISHQQLFIVCHSAISFAWCFICFIIIILILQYIYSLWMLFGRRKHLRFYIRIWWLNPFTISTVYINDPNPIWWAYAKYLKYITNIFILVCILILFT